MDTAGSDVDSYPCAPYHLGIPVFSTFQLANQHKDQSACRYAPRW